MDRFLPLNALRAFEASARLGSFKRAAEELGVTSAAVGQQVRALEKRIGRSLLDRSGGGLLVMPDLTDAVEEIRQGLDGLARGYAHLDPREAKPSVTISVAPTFAIKWLVPRLHRFYERYPEIDVVFDTAMRFVDVAKGEADVALRFGSGRYPGLRRQRLLDEWLLPLCSPALCPAASLSVPIKDLPRFTLLHLKGETTDRSWTGWPEWAKGQGLDGSGASTGPQFTQSAAALQAAIEGQGIVLSGISYALDDILAGRLCAPFGMSCAVKTRYAYDAVYVPARAEKHSVRVFLRWLKAEADISRQSINDFLNSE